MKAKARTAKGNILLTTTDAKPALGPEGYELTVSRRTRWSFAPPSPRACFTACSRCCNCCRRKSSASKPVAGVDWKIPCVQIEDQPRFKWRGLMLDVARHFFTKDEVEQLLDEHGAAQDQYAPLASDR